jgi:hypothetical protein
VASKAKKKIGDSSTKKDKKKDKNKPSKEPSITDVIAVDLIEKAKKTIEPDVKNEEIRTPSPPPKTVSSKKSPIRFNSNTTLEKTNDKNSKEKDEESDVQTVSDNVETENVQEFHHKELSQLKDLQNRIHHAKRTFVLQPNKSSGDVEMRDESNGVSSNTQKKSIKNRLGVKATENSKPSNIIRLSDIRKTEKELESKTFRKLIEKQKEENERRDVRKSVKDRIEPIRYRRRSRSNSRDRYRNSRDKVRRRSRSRSPIKTEERKSRPNVRERIGSKVIIRNDKSPQDDIKIKVKQRPTLSSAITARAGKSLLLRAVAEAQRSTSKTSSEANKKQRDNIIVQVNNDKRNKHEEYIPETKSGLSEPEAEYRPSSQKSQDDIMDDDENIIFLNSQEDVNYDDLDNIHQDSSRSSHSPTPPPVIKRHVRNRIGNRINFGEQTDKNNKRSFDDEECESQRAFNKVSKRKLSPIKFDLTDDESEHVEEKSRSSSHDVNDKKNSSKSEESGEESQAKRIRLESLKSYDHLPSCKKFIIFPVH